MGLYTQLAISKHKALDASLTKARSKSKHCEREAKADAEKIELVEKERDEAKQKAKVARPTAVPTGDAKARAEDDLTRARDALAATEEDERKLEAEVTRLAVEQMSLLLELEASKDEVSSLHSQAGKDKEAMVEDYKKAMEQNFLMVTDATRSNITYAVTYQGFRMACLTLLTHFLQSFLQT